MNSILKSGLFIASLALFLFMGYNLFRSHEIANLASMIAAGNTEGVSRLIAAHPQLVECDVIPGEQRTPLSFAANIGQFAICSNLIVAGAKINTQDKSGLTPLHWALNMSRTNIVQLLLQHGADVTIKTWEGRTPLDFANQRTTSSYLQQLLSIAMFKATNRQPTILNTLPTK